jgi:hypothetical protein
MKLALHVPERVEFDLRVTHRPEKLRPGVDSHLTLRVHDPANGAPVRDYSVVHERLMHLFVVSEDLEDFAHIHPELQPDGSFQVSVCFRRSGMYRLLADYYPSQSVPQLSIATLFVSGPRTAAHLSADLAPKRASNLEASLRTDPDPPLAGLETKLFYNLTPSQTLEPYLGAWGHMLIASQDVVDLIHTHPFLSDPQKGQIQFNAIFPRPGLYRVWTQFQRSGVVNTTVFTLPIRGL